MRLLNASLAVVALAVVACGSSGAEQRSRPWRLVRAPVVVLWLGSNRPPPSYEVYFRLDQPLSSTKDAVVVSLDGITSYDTNGLGYDESTRGRCYAKGIDNVDDYPRSLRHPRAGDLVTVRLRFLRGRKDVVIRRVPLQIARPGEAGPPVANPVWWRLLGC